jgi:hypothetical protein
MSIFDFDGCCPRIATTTAINPIKPITMIERVTSWPTEADLEAEIHGALRQAFPWLPEGAIRHQTRFSFPLGRHRIEIDGGRDSRAEARADILLYYGEQPLAVLELKRKGVTLTTADESQGLSYARMLHPRPPLVVVTNGDDVRRLEVHSGEEWLPETPSEVEFARLVEAASRAAGQDLKHAIETLMGSTPSIWTQAIRAATHGTITELTGPWECSQLQFVSDFLIPRKATAEALQLLREGKRLILIAGPPLVGKSNVLRELVARTGDSDDLVILFLPADEGGGIFRKIADTLSAALSWPINSEDARTWVMRLSKAGGPALVLALDGICPEFDDLRRDVEDLSSEAFGPSMRIVLTLDDAIAERLLSNTTGRQASAIGRRATGVWLGLLDDEEFEVACRVLWNHRMSIMNGGRLGMELRVPWVLRSMGADVVSLRKHAQADLTAVLPPLLSLDLIEHTRGRFQDDEIRRLFRSLAGAVLEDAQDQRRPIALILESLAVFVVRRDTLRKHLEYAEIEDLIARGYLKPLVHESGEAILVVHLPELLASEAANLLGIELAQRARTDSKVAAEWLEGAASNLPLGDIVAAQAIVDAALRHGGVPWSLISALLATPPKCEVIRPGTKVAMLFLGGGILNITFQADGSTVLEAAGQRQVFEADPDETPPVSYSRFHSWLVLSHLASGPLVIAPEGKLGRVDTALLIEVGTCPMVLRRPGLDQLDHSIVTHKIPDVGSIVCHLAGIVEPITLSILRFLSAEGKRATEWIIEAVERESLPLLARIDIALRVLSGSAYQNKVAFSQNMLTNVIRPALKKNLFPLH